MEGRKNVEEFYRKLKVGMKLKYAFTTVIVTFAVAMVVSLVSIVMMNVDTYKFYKEAYANSTLQMEIRKDIQLVGKYILWSMTTDDTGSTQSYLNSAQKYADQVGKNVTTLEKSYNDKKKVAELKDAIEELKKQRVALMELAQQNKNDEATKKMVYLPEGEWYDYWTGEKITGGKYFLRDAPIDLCPMYLKEGTMIPMYEKMAYVGEKPYRTLYLLTTPGEASYDHFQDNGEDYAYRKGVYNLYHFHKNAQGVLETEMRHKNYPEYEQICLKIVGK